MRRTSRGGFTLLEILVALVLIGLLVGTLVPAVLNQLSRGEVTRVIEDIGAVGNGVRAFRVDVNRWPGKLEDLMTRPSSTAKDLNEIVYPSGLLARWGGPYLEHANIEGGQLETADGGLIQSDFESAQIDARDYLVVVVNGLSLGTAEAVDLAVDGEPDYTTGRVRIDDSAPNQPVLRHYVVPLR